MAEHAWTVLCNSTMIEPETKVISLVNVVEKLTLQPVPGDAEVERELARAHSEGKKGLYFPVQLRLVSWWVRSDLAREETLELRISLLNPTGEKMLEQEVILDLAKFASQRLTLHLDKLQITGLGRYWFLVEECKGTKSKPKWARAGRVPLEIETGESAKS